MVTGVQEARSPVVTRPYVGRQWLPRTKLEPLGVDPALDKAKLVESRKAADRKAVKTAYEKGILHQCRVTGKSAAFGPDDRDKTAAELYYKNAL